MEFERMRREFYRKKFNIYLAGNHDRLGEVKRLYQTSGHNVTQFGIPCDDIKMEQGEGCKYLDLFCRRKRVSWLGS